MFYWILNTSLVTVFQQLMIINTFDLGESFLGWPLPKKPFLLKNFSEELLQKSGFLGFIPET